MKSEQYGCRGAALECIQSHLFNRFHSVKFGDTFSCWAATVRGGGAQRSKHSPSLSTLYTNDLPNKSQRFIFEIFHMLLTYFTSLRILCAFTIASSKTNVSLDEKLLPSSRKFKN